MTWRSASASADGLKGMRIQEMPRTRKKSQRRRGWNKTEKRRFTEYEAIKRN